MQGLPRVSGDRFYQASRNEEVIQNYDRHQGFICAAPQVGTRETAPPLLPSEFSSNTSVYPALGFPFYPGKTYSA